MALAEPTTTRRPAVTFQPAARRAVQRGINTIADAVRHTLGPSAGFVATTALRRGDPPEVLDDGALIARRIVQLPDRGEDVGAMLLRHLLWRLHERVGDGTATAAVLTQCLCNEGARVIAAGRNAARIGHYLETGLALVLDRLTAQAEPVRGREQLGRLAESFCHDPELAELLGEIFDVVGELGRLEIRARAGRGLEREYLEGMYWQGGLLTRPLAGDGPKLRELENAAILIGDLEIDEPGDVVGLLRMAVQAGIGALAIVTPRISETATAVLLANQGREDLAVLAVRTPGWGPDEQAAAMEDMAVLTGGRPRVSAAGDRLVATQPEHLGRARRAWADPSNFGVVGGKGSPRALRQHIAQLRAAFDLTSDRVAREKVRERIGKLLGGSATLWIGGVTTLQRERRVALAERTADAMRGAILEGVVPGAGVALLECRAAVGAAREGTSDPDARAAYAMLVAALEAPCRAIAQNVARDPALVIAEIERAGPGCGFDARTGAVVDVREAGLLDSAATVKAAIHGAVHCAATALTIDVLVHHREPEEVLAAT